MGFVWVGSGSAKNTPGLPPLFTRQSTLNDMVDGVELILQVQDGVKLLFKTCQRIWKRY
jgi:hypothetical protein